VQRVVVPWGAGVFSAFGLLVSPLGFDVAQTARQALAELGTAALEEHFGSLEERTLEMLRRARLTPQQVALVRAADLRYQGQGYTVEVSADTLDPTDAVGALAQRFVDAYTRLYGVAAMNAPIEIVHWKVAGIGPVEPLDIRQAGQASDTAVARQALKGQRSMYIPEAGGFQPGAVYDRYALRPGDTVPGPAVVEERESSLVLFPGSSGRVDAHLNMVVTLSQ
jgi:N-methylhydantoinase A